MDIEIRTGGQTGVDRAALDVALELGIPHAGWVPRGRLAEDGAIPPRYGGLRETESDDYAERTWRNIRDSDGTVVLRWGPATGGTLLTLELVRQHGSPLLDLDIAGMDVRAAASLLGEWVTQMPGIRRLNVAGPRASRAPEAYDKARSVLAMALAEISNA